MYRNLNRPGLRTTATIDPRAVQEDITLSLKSLSPEATPLLSIVDKISKGPPPKSKKIWVAQEHLFDDVDRINRVVLGSSVGPNYSRFALLWPEQLSRPDVRNQMYYSPQDKLYIEATGQTVEVVANPVASIRIGLGPNDFFQFDDALIGGPGGTMVNKTPEGTILVRNVEAAPILPFQTSWFIYMGRTIFESQDIEAVPKQRDYIWDTNFVEHKEAEIQMTEDQKNIITTKLKVPDWNFQQKRAIEEFKREVERTLIFGQRAVDLTIPARPKYYANGILNTIRTNVAYYDPDIPAGEEFERLVQWFIYEQAFRYNPGGTQKIALCGGKFLMKFNQSFANYRRSTSLKLSGSVGFDLSAYDFMGYTLALTHYEGFRQGTPMENWCLVFDPSLIEYRTVKDFTNRLIVPGDNNFIRYYSLVIEWQGTLAFQLEEAHALLRS
ncbi:SU10 major capsid protein [Caldisericum sp.]|uniref:SU10 major capsid protein n=1 Tax=Caldisericum sp. TaxID=2499687 RepID=UPI003D0C7161